MRCSNDDRGGDFWGGRGEWGEAGGAEHGVSVETGGVEAVAVVAAAVEDDGGGAVLVNQIEDDGVALREVGVGQAHLTKAVVLVEVGTGDPEDDIGVEAWKKRREGEAELMQEFRAGDVAGKRDVEIAGGFDRRVVFADVNGVGEDTGILGEDGVGAVALVGVGVDDEDAGVGGVKVEGADGDGDVVEHAVAEAPVGEGVVGATGEVTGEALAEGGVEGGEGATGFEAGAEEEGGAGGKAEANGSGMIEGGGFDGVQVGIEVDVKQKIERSGGGGKDCDAASGFGADHGLGTPEFIHGERMLGRERENIIGVVEATHIEEVKGAWRKVD